MLEIDVCDDIAAAGVRIHTRAGRLRGCRDESARVVRKLTGGEYASVVGRRVPSSMDDIGLPRNIELSMKSSARRVVSSADRRRTIQRRPCETQQTRAPIETVSCRFEFCTQRRCADYSTRAKCWRVRYCQGTWRVDPEVSQRIG